MKIISKIKEPEFELEFLSSEWYKPFYNSVRDKFNGLIVSPNLDNWQENYIRKELLWKWRYPLLAQLPLNIEWYIIELEIQEFENLLVIREDGWNKTFGLGKNLKEAALSVKNNMPDLWGVDFNHIKQIKSNIGQHPFKEKIILISLSLNSVCTVIEGNHRAVAFELEMIETSKIDHIPKQLILGISADMNQAYWLNMPSSF
ncbi:MAG: hypothetical protein A3D74_02875 [Candidatus Levybacteria bacterium RIFCSPHIGHO2_02_FULL_37_13]|nr:MAG: hypothetical protein A3D74_02875 [Candidatus Levybacteria bacterium RIFCSPHIGHO2_02_FULL_37_13]OGH29483.1 MAG: hypothetical protein A3E40_03885 [Candidatus Levybacteria bacterium RIFCSPHIGHO2_12_FULL_37_9]OGH40322.1 MAG: hypothetical protein A3B41_00130 [Candidatus Levybacteria bacterium RIFCSPLOWO2_01_FULL_37_26]